MYGVQHLVLKEAKMSTLVCVKGKVPVLAPRADGIEVILKADSVDEGMNPIGALCVISKY